MSDFQVAHRYSKSVLAQAQEEGVLDRVAEDLSNFRKLYESNRDLLLLLRSPIIRHEKKAQVLRSLFSEKYHKVTMGLMQVTAAKGRESLLPRIVEVFEDQYNEIKKIGSATLTSAVKLDSSIINDLKSKLKEVTQKDYQISEEIDESIIGGFILKMREQQLDASVKSQLKKVKSLIIR